MNKFRFRRLMAVLQDRVEKSGKHSPDWFLGFIEGYGNRRLTGVQVGALYELLVVRSCPDPATVDSSCDE